MPKRVQRTRKKGGGMPEGAVYVGRPGKWGNPFPVAHGRHTAAYAFELWIKGDHCGREPERHAQMKADMEELRGKDLACWCPLDQPCHADTLLELANGHQEKPDATT